MTKQVQIRRGTATQHTSFTGAEGEISINTTNDTVHVHDGLAAGGVEMARSDLGNVLAANVAAALAGSTLSSITLTTADINGGTIDGTIIGNTTPAAGNFTSGSFTGNLSFGDNAKAIFGAGSDLQIYHDGTHSYLLESNGTGNLYLGGDNLILTNANATKVYVKGIDGGATELRHNNSQKLATTATGIDVTGTVTADGLTVDSIDITSDASVSVPTLSLTDKDTSISIGQSIGRLSFQSDDASPDAAGERAFVRGYLADGFNYALDFGAKVSNGSLNTVMTVRADGNVGIGTSSFGWATSGRGLVEINGSSSAFYGAKVGNVKIGYLAATASVLELAAVANVPLTFLTNNTERLRIDSSGNVGIGTSSPEGSLEIKNTSATLASPHIAIEGSGGAEDDFAIYAPAGENTLRFGYSYAPAPVDNILVINGNGNVGIGTAGLGTPLGVYHATDNNIAKFQSGDALAYISIADNTTSTVVGVGATGNDLQMFSSGVERLRIDASGNVGIGTSSPEGTLHVENVSNNSIIMDAPANRFNSIGFQTAGVDKWWLGRADSDQIAGDAFFIGIDNGNATDAGGLSNKLVITQSGNVGIGTSSPDARLSIVDGTSSDQLRMGSGTSYYKIGRNTSTGLLEFNGIQSGFNGYVFGGANGERMRIDSSGNVLVNTTASNIYDNSGSGGGFVSTSGWNAMNGVNDAALYLNRVASDGVIQYFFQDGSIEGNISVSGTTVSYNGGHLARWSQLTDGTKDETIVKGTVMTNLDQMAVWSHDAVEAKDAYTEDNEQLNCMAVSSVEGDPNVAGVFVNWDNDDDKFNDMNIAMTGDMVIRIAQGTTVARGDLLMSAGDGTAKPQGDDIVRSKTIAKVTSTNVSHTYDDGSYLVPCVLMAC